MRRLRRVVTWLALILMVSVIAGYWIATDRTRVRQFVEKRLSRELGARVSVGDARLSIFEGLRVDDVRVMPLDGDPRPVFEAKRLQIGYDPGALFGGDVAAERVVVVEPRVRLVEDLDNRRWNFHVFKPRAGRTATTRASAAGRFLSLPEVLVRNARFDYSQVENGRESPVNTLHLEAAFTPDKDGLYRFRVQSRGGGERAFPVAEGSLKGDQSAVRLVVNDVEFVDEIKAILPAQVRRFWEEHRLSGRMDELAIDWSRDTAGRAKFRVTCDLAGVNLVVPPTRWMGAGDRKLVERWQDAYAALGGGPLGGSAVARGLVGRMTPAPLVLHDVDARCVFTDERVTVENLLAHVDGNALRFSGHVDGYTPDAAADVTIDTPPGTRLAFRRSPEFIDAMPWPVQEIYYRFRPVGTADLWLRARRAKGQDRLTLAGELNAADATFEFDRMPYPVERASGKFRFGNDPVTGRERLEIVHVTGHGPAAGPNADATLGVYGTISPLDETAGADIHVTGRNIRAEPRLIASLPPLTQQAVRNFDADGTGRLPTFRGDFGCDVFRQVGLGRPWTIATRLDLLDGSGKFRGFPYPLAGVSGSLRVFDDHVDLLQVKAPAGGGTAELRGAIHWSKHDPATGEPVIQPDLVVSTRGVAIDRTLLDALPPSKRAPLARLGLSGRVDVDGTILPSGPLSEEPAVDLRVKLTGGRSRPPDVPVVVDDLRASVRVKGERADVDAFDGTVAGARVSGSAVADGGGPTPRVSAEAFVERLDAAAAPVDALPPEASKAVRSLHARGFVDASVAYDGPDDYRVVVRPRGLSVTPNVLPLRLDASGGRVTVVPGVVRLEKLSAKHGDAPLTLDGTIDARTGDADVTMAARDLVVDPALTRALPQVLQAVVEATALAGPVAIDCPRFVLKQPTTSPASPSVTSFDAKLWLQKSSMRLAADVRDVVGSVAVRGDVRGDTLTQLDGDVSIDDMTFAGRRVGRLVGTMAKREGDDVLRFGDLSARIAGGQIGGRVDAVLDRRDPRFGLELRLRNARVGELGGDAAMDATVSGSLAMEGRWNDPAARRGRGDVLVQGKAMARVPLVFGLLQVANLTVPDAEPIRQAALRYTLLGNTVRMDQIDLRSSKSVMSGRGTMDFDKLTVELDLALAESAADALPLFGDLIKNARQDLMRLRIKGSLVGAGDGGAFGVFDGTADDVQKR